MGPDGGAGTWGPCGPSVGRPAHTPLTLPPESALDDLDLNEFGVAALEKTFDNSTVSHPGSITMGTGQWGARVGAGSEGPAWPRGGPAGSPLLGVAPHGPPSPHSAPLLASVAGGSLLQSSAPVNIPGSLGSSASFHSASPSPPVSLSSHFLQQPQGHLSQSENTFLGTSASHGSLGKSQYGSLRPGAGVWAFGKCLWAFCPGWRQYRVEVRAGDLGSEVSQAPHPQCSELCEPGQVT